jgi:hypothetical protein
MYVSMLGSLILELNIDALVTPLENNVPVEIGSADAVLQASSFSTHTF